MLPSSFLFYGPSGCAKTLLASATFNEIKKSDPLRLLVKLKNPEILTDPYAKLKESFGSITRYQISDILIEDVDELLCDLPTHPAARRYLLGWIKNPGENRLLIGTARRPNTLSADEIEAFTHVLPLLYPNFDNRVDILRVVSKSVCPDLSLNFGQLAKETEWWSGKELKDLLTYASRLGKKNVDATVLNTALESIGASVDVESRKRRTAQLLVFTAKYCTFPDLRTMLKSELGDLSSNDVELDIDKLVELKPGFFGFSIDLKEIFKYIWRRIKK